MPSNVAKLARAVANSGPDDEGNLVKQIVSYHSNLGSGDLPFQKAIYGGFGWGLDIDVAQIYDFISNNYEPGDELFFFGFSRGAFTVRSVAGLVCDVGVLSAVHMSRFAEMWSVYRSNTSGEPFRKSAWYLDNKEELGLTDVRVKVVGVWDTVGALGIPEWPVVDWAAKVGLPINKQYAFHNTNVSKNYAFQALAIDEKRLTFSPTLWHKTADGPAKDLQQCWFPGVHGNIGGWGCGPIVDNFSGLQGLFFWLLGKKDRAPGTYPRDPGDGTSGATNEYFHPITRIRKDNLNYNPVSLQGYAIERPDGSEGWKWVKRGVQSIPEYVMRPEKKMSVAYEESGRVKYRVKESLSRLLCPESILLDLDRDNGINGMSRVVG
uniref:T6SS Phospholipase effector Tle1-like catalytic domain-containing protein n=1 Tax=Fusarium oxysporum (strain Fo5176) TaxID=660025 RepID=A0A0D2YKL4_FUSOF